jgi:CRP-like cAMP-binding protein
MNYTFTQTLLIDPDILTQLTEYIGTHGMRANFEKGQALFFQNTPVSSFFYVHDGLVKLHRQHGKDRCSILKVEKANHFAGLSDCFSQRSHHLSATTIAKSDVSILDAGMLIEYISSQPDLSETIMTLLAQEATHFLERLSNRHHKQLPGRVADTLLYFWNLLGENNQFCFPLNRSELAQFAGTTKESLIRTLTEFKNDKIINMNDRDVEINSMEILKTLCRLG